MKKITIVVFALLLSTTMAFGLEKEDAEVNNKVDESVTISLSKSEDISLEIYKLIEDANGEYTFIDEAVIQVFKSLQETKPILPEVEPIVKVESIQDDGKNDPPVKFTKTKVEVENADKISLEKGLYLLEYRAKNGEEKCVNKYIYIGKAEDANKYKVPIKECEDLKVELSIPHSDKASTTTTALLVPTPNKPTVPSNPPAKPPTPPVNPPTPPAKPPTPPVKPPEEPKKPPTPEKEKQKPPKHSAPPVEKKVPKTGDEEGIISFFVIFVLSSME